jgi:hypothetical protein
VASEINKLSLATAISKATVWRSNMAEVALKGIGRALNMASLYSEKFINAFP